MKHLPDPSRIEVLDPAIVEILKQKTPAERLAMAFAANRTMRLRLEGHLKTCHPDWTDEQVQAEIAKRMLSGATGMRKSVATLSTASTSTIGPSPLD